jgi:hypothetical protein
LARGNNKSGHDGGRGGSAFRPVSACFLLLKSAVVSFADSLFVRIKFLSDWEKPRAILVPAVAALARGNNKSGHDGGRGGRAFRSVSAFFLLLESSSAVVSFADSLLVRIKFLFSDWEKPRAIVLVPTVAALVRGNKSGHNGGRGGRAFRPPVSTTFLLLFVESAVVSFAVSLFVRIKFRSDWLPLIPPRRITGGFAMIWFFGENFVWGKKVGV